MKFEPLNLIEPICSAIHEANYSSPTPIQRRAVPYLLKGKDLIGCAQTGTGKTGAFAWPILQKLSKLEITVGPKKVFALILSPTRELAMQINESFYNYGRYLQMKQAVIFGGVQYKSQKKLLSKGVDILVATPGRLLDFLERDYLQLKQVKFLVLDEADRMLDMGFLPDINKIIALTPRKRQSMLFSATFPKEVVNLTQDILKDPISVKISPKSVAAKHLEQKVLFVDRENKSDLLIHVLKNEKIFKGIVFVRTRHGAKRMFRKLVKNDLRAETLHGNQSQVARIKALKKFKSGESPFLVATDLASRGLDMQDISHVLNYELPNEPESYIHRIGRTARAGASGVAISLCDFGECGYLRKIEKAINSSVTVIQYHPFHSDAVFFNFKRKKKTRGKTSTQKKNLSKKKSPKVTSKFKGYLNRKKRISKKPKRYG